MKTKAKVNGKVRQFKLDMAGLLEYGQLIGVDDINQIQAKMQEVLQGVSPEDGKVLISSVQSIAKLATVAARVGSYYSGGDEVSEREMLNAILSDEGGDIVTAVVGAISELNGGGLATKKKKPQAKKS